jgi:uncharacterized protein
MRRTARTTLLALALAAAGFSGAGPAAAQYGYGYGYGYTEGPRRPPREAYPDPYSARPGYRDAYRDPYRDPYARRAPPRPAPEPQREFYWPWEDRPTVQPQPQRPAYVPRRERNYYADQPARPRRPAPKPAPVIAREPPAKPKTNPTVQIAVFGDSLAELVGQGIDEAFSDNADVAVFRRARGDSGLVRRDVVDWPKAAADYLASNPKVTYAVVMLGANDRQAIRDGDGSVEPGTDRWRELYRDRVDALIKVFTDRKLPLVWIGAPPMRNEGLSANLASLNDLYRERVEKAGGTYVDIWPAFVDDQNRYAASGPDVDGQTARLRLPDGVHFTPAGYRKAAHFADVAIKRLMDGRAAPSAPAVASLPSVEPPKDAGEAKPAAPLDDAAAIERLITASLPSLPEPPGLPALPAKPVSGPVLPLTRTEVSPGGVLASGRPRLDTDAGYTADRALNRGATGPAPRGRADDFRWPAN